MSASAPAPRATAAPATTRLGGGSLAACLSAFALIGASQALHGPALPGLAVRFGVDSAAAVLVVGAHWSGALVAVLALLPARVEAAVPSRPAIACAAIGIGALGLAHAPTFGAALCASAAVGAGYGWLTVGLNSLFARGAAGRGPVMVNLLNAAFGVGAIAAPLAIARLGLGHRPAFEALGVAALVVAPFLVRTEDRHRRCVPDTTGRDRAGHDRTGRDRPADPDAARTLTLLGVGLVIAFESSLAAWGPSALRDSGVDETGATLALALYFAVFLGARLAAVGLSLLIEPRALLLATLGGASIACLAAPFVPGPATLFAAAGVVGAAFPAAFLWATARLGESPSGGSSSGPIIVAAALCGGVAGPVTIGHLGRVTGEGVSFVLLGLVGAAAFALVLSPRRRRARRA